MNLINRHGRFNNMSKIDRSLESMESLNELIILYKQDIDTKLDTITPNKTLQSQIKAELGIY
jgi:exo-beta-1,3-glucanase (GH17 family)